LVREGNISQAIFQSRCLSLAWSLRPHNINQTSGQKGEVLPEEEAETNSWADLTEKRPEGDGAHDHLSNEVTWGIWIFKIFWTESVSNRSYNNCEFQALTPGRINSATVKGGRSNRLTFGLGLKFGKVGIQWEFQTSIFSRLEIEMQAPNSTTFLFFNKPFQIPEDRELKGAFRKEIPCWRYLPLRASTQRRGWLVVIFQPSPANKELFWNSIEWSPKPPKAFGEHILSQERKERLWFLSWGKPHQNFRIKVLISEQKYLGRRKRDIIYVGIALTTDLTRVVQAVWIKDELSNQ